MAKIATLTDDFSGAALDPAKWTTVWSALLTIDAGQLRMNAAPEYPIIESAATYDATGSSLVVLVTPPPIGNGTNSAEVGFLRDGGANMASVLFAGGQITVRVRTGGEVTASTSLGPYASGSTWWARIRHVSGTTYAGEVSDNGETWTGGSVQIPWDTTLVRAFIVAGRYGHEDAEWTWFDDVNLFPGPSGSGTLELSGTGVTTWSGLAERGGTLELAATGTTTFTAGASAFGTLARSAVGIATFSGFYGRPAEVTYWDGDEWLPADVTYWNGLTWLPATVRGI